MIKKRQAKKELRECREREGDKVEYKREKREYRALCDEKKEEDNQRWEKRAGETKWRSKVESNEQGKEREKKD